MADLYNPSSLSVLASAGLIMGARENNADQPLVEPLTRREREILALLALGLSGPEIASELTLAVNSIKWYLKQIYSKLGVNSRQQAVARARELSLLGSAGPAPTPEVKPAPKHNLPLQVNRFFGREREVAQLVERVSENRLVTLTGPGGVGKTRLSLRAAETLLPDYAAGVWLVELAALTDPALVPQQVAASLGLRDDSQRPISEILVAFLGDRQLLLVLDNCEHLLAACGRLADTLLRACPDLRLLASSREPLGISGEAVFSVPSLSFPDPEHLPPIDTLHDFVAVCLFLDRARLVLPDYQVSAENAAWVARICQRLDGIPLAIEMAAARVNVLSAERLSQRLDDAFRVLTGGSRSALPRQQTLRATIDWSYNLLRPEERRLFQRLSVFTGGCTLEAAEAVCSGDGLASALVLDGLVALVAKSMVIADRLASGQTRYHLLETVRQYAREKLRDQDRESALRARHRDYFLTFAETNWRLTVRWGMVATQLAADIDNVRAALQWSFDEATTSGDLNAGPKLVLAFREIWPSYQEQVEWYRRAAGWCREHPAVAGDVRAFVLSLAADPLSQNDPARGLSLRKEATALSRELGPAGKDALIGNLWLLGLRLLWDLNDTEQCAALFAEAEALLPDLARQGPPDEYLAKLAWLALGRADLASRQGQYENAKRHGSDALRHFQKATLEFGVLQWGDQRALIVIGNACLALRQYGEARDRFLQAQALTDSAPGVWRQLYQASVPHSLAQVDYLQGNLERAQWYCRASLVEAEQIPDFKLVAQNLALAAGIGATRGQAARAARLLSAAQTLAARQGTRLAENTSLDTLLPDWRDRQDAPAISAAFAAGQALGVDEAIALALSAGDP